MNASSQQRLAAVNLPTVIALGALVISLNVGLHEGIHALSCLLFGADQVIYTALSVDCTAPTTAAGKIIPGSAPLFNLVLGFALFFYLRSRPTLGDTGWYGVWLFMLANLLYGAGYLLFSGVANVGDVAAVIDGWQPAWLWRGLTLIVGAAAYMGVVALALRIFGTRVGGTADEQFGRASRMAIWSYVGIAIPVIVAASFHPDGLTGLPTVAGLAAVLLGMSPLLWMMQWFRAEMFIKQPGPPLSIQPSPLLIVAALLVVVVYGVLLGRGLTL